MCSSDLDRGRVVFQAATEFAGTAFAATEIAATEFAAANLHLCSRFGARRGGAELRIEVTFEGFETRGDGFGSREFCGDGVGGL